MMSLSSTRLRFLSAGPASTTSRTLPARSQRTRISACDRRARSGVEHALISLLALNGLRVSGATGAELEALGLERGRRNLTIVCKSGKVVTIPLAPRTASAVDLTVGERCEGPVFLAADGSRLDR